jgi:aldose 1-epimerase
MIKEYYKFNKLSRYAFINIENESNLKVTFTNIGASIYTIYYKDRLITFTPLDDFNYFIHNGMHYGKTLGRTAGRIKNGIAIIDGKKYYLNKKGEHTLHGGKGFQYHKYKYIVKELDDEYQVIFKNVSKDNDQGYPGNLSHQVIYHLKKNEDTLEIEYFAVSDKDTLCNLSNHIYWNLEGDMNLPIYDEELVINADKYVVVDNELIYKATALVDEQFDFRKPMPIKKHLFDKDLQESFAKGYDHDWILNKKDPNGPDAILTSKNHDITLEFYSTYPVCHVFTSNCFIDRYKYHAIALEFQKEIFHQEKVILRKDEIYHHSIKFSFKN